MPRIAKLNECVVYLLWAVGVNAFYWIVLLFHLYIYVAFAFHCANEANPKRLQTVSCEWVHAFTNNQSIAFGMHAPPSTIME